MVRIPEENPLLCSGQPRNIDNPNTISILSTVSLSNFRSFDTRATRVATKNRGSMDLFDGNVKGRRRNFSQALFNPECSLQCPHTPPNKATPGNRHFLSHKAKSAHLASPFAFTAWNSNRSQCCRSPMV